MSVTFEHYEINDAGRALAEAHFAAVDAARQAAFSYAKEIGADSVQIGNRGGILAFAFKGEVPAGLRRTGERDAYTIAVPNMKTERGREIADRMSSSDLHGPTDEDLVRQFGFSTASLPTDGRSLYFPTVTRLRLPTERFVLKLPFDEGRGLAPHPGLTPLQESEYIAAFENHNAAVRARAA